MDGADPFASLDLAPAPRRIEDLETPVPIIDLDVVERNLTRWQDRCDALGVANRPHVKTHKNIALARRQIALGAKGITVQKLGEAEVMADAGITDLLLTFNIVGAAKLRRLAALAERTDIAVVADNAAVVAGVAEAGGVAGRPISILVECDTGAKRNGVQTPEAAAALARLIDRTPGASYGGLMTYPAKGTRAATEAFLTEARDLAAAAGLETATISTGGTPDMWRDEGLGIATEYRAGTYIYFDRSHIAGGACAEADCALDVLATVVSRPTADRAVIDAGSKALTSDLLGLEGYGVARGLGAVVYAHSEEHGLLDMRGAAQALKVGDLVRIIPNHVCPVSNLYDRVVFTRGGEALGYATVHARGRVA